MHWWAQEHQKVWKTLKNNCDGWRKNSFPGEENSLTAVGQIMNTIQEVGVSVSIKRRIKKKRVYHKMQNTGEHQNNRSCQKCEKKSILEQHGQMRERFYKTGRRSFCSLKLTGQWFTVLKDSDLKHTANITQDFFSILVRNDNTSLWLTSDSFNYTLRHIATVARGMSLSRGSILLSLLPQRWQCHCFTSQML